MKTQFSIPKLFFIHNSNLSSTFFIFVVALMFGPLTNVSFSSSEISNKRFSKVKKIKTLVTAYCPCQKCCGSYSDGITSTGKNAFKVSGVAADPSALPYGSWVHIPGIGYREVDDTGGAMRKSWRKNKIYHLDLRFKNHQEALQWGRQWLDVDVYAQR